ncbi:MAG: hypothetical protein RR838_01080 [Clostridium sp.]
MDYSKKHFAYLVIGILSIFIVSFGIFQGKKVDEIVFYNHNLEINQLSGIRLHYKKGIYDRENINYISFPEVKGLENEMILVEKNEGTGNEKAHYKNSYLLINLLEQADRIGMDLNKVLSGKTIKKIKVTTESGREIIKDIGRVKFNPMNMDSISRIDVENENIIYDTLFEALELVDYSGDSLDRIISENEIYLNDIRLTQDIIPLKFNKGEFNIKINPKKNKKEPYNIENQYFTLKFKNAKGEIVNKSIELYRNSIELN